MKKVSFFGVLLVVMLLAACGRSKPTDPIPVPQVARPTDSTMTISHSSCEYISVTGTAKIISIVPAPAKEYNCEVEPLKITIAFQPTDANARKSYKFTESDTSTLFAGGGKNPSKKWLDKVGYKVGQEFPAVRREITNGASCMPVVFDLRDGERPIWATCE